MTFDLYQHHHPFVDTDELNNKTTDELQQVISTLTENYRYAQRIGNMQLVSQLDMVLNSYQTVYKQKMDALVDSRKTVNKKQKRGEPKL